MKQDALEAGALFVARTLKSAGFEAYYAGGVVRDMLLGVPAKDYDIVSDATPEQVLSLFKKTVEVGIQFGVVRVLYQKGLEYEVATYREDGAYSDGRRPDEVVYSRSKEADVSRRDFTINALLMDPETREILDFVGGRADIEKKVVRAVGDPQKRFVEDRLRMLRALRFAVRFGFKIESDTWSALCSQSSEIGVVSKERILQELNGLWLSPRPHLGLEFLRDSGLLGPLFPWAGDIDFDWLTLALSRIPDVSQSLAEAQRLNLAWGLFFVCLQQKKTVLRECQRMKMSRAMSRGIVSLIEQFPVLARPKAFPVAERMRVIVAEDADVLEAFQLAGFGPESDTADVFGPLRRELLEHPLPELPLLGGDDLKSLGLTPSVEFKRMLRHVEDAVLERRISTRDEALELVKKNLG